MSEHTLQAAKQLAACGFKVLPIRSGSKAPACKHGVDDATVDAGQLEQWFAHSSNGVGVSGEGFVIFDFDRHGGADGLETLAEWEAEHGKLPETLAQTTPSGGYHLIYRATDEVRPSVNPDLAVDVRAWGSYVVCDPTPGYTWETEPEPANIAEVDGQVRAFLAHVQPGDNGKREPVKVPKDGLKEGGRNRTLYAMACSLQSQEWDDDAIRAAIETYNAMSCKPPLPAAEVDKLVASALSHPKGKSAEVKAQQGGKQPNHVKYGKRLIEERHACMVGEAPAVMAADGRSYRMGWDAITRAHLDMNEGAKIAEQREVRNFVKYRAPQATVSDPHLIAFSNGVLDVRTMELRAWEPDDVIPNVIPHAWEPEAECADVDVVLAKISAGDPSVELNLCEFAGLCMYRDSAKYGYMAILLGRQGASASNGKSTYIHMLASLLGSSNYSTLDMAIIGERFQAGHLVGKLANLGDDISNEYITGNVMATVKKATTGEEIYTDVKGGDGFKFRPYATMVFSANQMPKLGDNTEGVARRLFPIRFNARFSPNDADYDPDIMDKLATEQAAQRFAVRAVAGLRRVLEQKQPTPNRESRRMTEEIRTNNSSVLQWVDYEQLDAGWFVGRTPGVAYQEYKAWCVNGGYRHYKAINEFSKEIISEFDLESHAEKDSNNKTVKYYRVKEQ